MRLSLLTLSLATALILPFAASAASGSTTTVPPVSRLQDRVLGRLNAQVTMIEYADFECPFCRKHHPIMLETLKKNRRTVNWVYRHYPLTSIHPNAQSSAIAAECAAKVGGRSAFWPYSEALMKASKLSQLTYEAEATLLDIDLAKFRACQADAAISKKIDAQRDGGVTAGVAGTPTVFLLTKDGRSKTIAGAVDQKTIQSTINELTKKY